LSDHRNIPKVGVEIDREIDNETCILKATGQSGADSRVSKTTHAKAIIDSDVNARSNAKIKANKSGEPFKKLKTRD